MHQHMLGADQVESSSAEKDLGVLVGNKLTMTQQCNIVAKASWAALGGVLPAGQGRGPLPSAQHW